MVPYFGRCRSRTVPAAAEKMTVQYTNCSGEKEEQGVFHTPKCFLGILDPNVLNLNAEVRNFVCHVLNASVLDARIVASYSRELNSSTSVCMHA